MNVREPPEMHTDQRFEELYSAHYPRILALCRYLLNSTDAAQDAAHEVFLRAQRSIHTYDPNLPFAGWIAGIASHYCVDILRRRTTESRIFGSGEDEPVAVGLSPLSSMILSERGSDVRAALAGLPDKYRVPLVMAYYNEWTYDQIAETLGLHRNHVATLIYRGKQQMREILAHHATKGVRE